jgi:hypothetical protein
MNNGAATTHGLRSKKLAKVVDEYRVALVNQLMEERGGRDALDVVSRIAIETYALNCAQAKTIEARLDQDGLFTQTGRRRSAFDMLRSVTETIDRLKNALPPVVVHPSEARVDLDNASRSELIARTSAALRELLQEEDEERRSDAITARDAGLDVQSSAESTEEALASTPAPAPQPDRCIYCKRSPCYGESHFAYRALHHHDPLEVARRDREATDIMRKQLGRPLPSWYFE